MEFVIKLALYLSIQDHEKIFELILNNFLKKILVPVPNKGIKVEVRVKISAGGLEYLTSNPFPYVYTPSSTIPGLFNLTNNLPFSNLTI